MNTSPTSRPSPTLLRRLRRRWPIVAGAVLVLLIVVGLMPRPLPVETARVSRGSLQVTVDEEGRTRVRQRYVVASPAAGHMQRIELKAGAVVQADDTILTHLETSSADLLDARTLAQAEARVRTAEAARDQARALLEMARAGAELAALELNRIQSLATQSIASRQDLDLALTRARSTSEQSRAAESGVRVADSELEQARAVLTGGGRSSAPPALVPVRSPVGGKILRVLQESARTVPAGLPLVEIGDSTDLEVLVEVLSRDAVAVHPGAEVWLEQWGGLRPLQARVRTVEPSGFTKISALGVEEQRVNIIADLVDPAENRLSLGDAYRVEARIVVWSGTDLVLAPTGALFQQDGRWQVFVVRGHRAQLRTVQPGRSNGLLTAISEGLEPDEEVIVYPSDALTDGARVQR